jgi:crotonobetainyl-CoA:carnitine CoA-transferase CaiB-like acyl-CoA transferase
MGVAVNASLATGVPWQGSPFGANVAPTNPLTGFYRTADGRFLSLSMLQAIRYWSRFCERIGRPDLATDERFSSHERLAANAAVATAELRAVLGGRSLAEWRAVLDGFDGQWAAVVDTVEVAADPQVRANGMIVRTERDGETYELVASPVRFDGSSCNLEPAPEFAEHTEAVLLELGHDWEHIAGLKERGVIA